MESCHIVILCQEEDVQYSLKIDSHKYRQLIFDKGARIVFSTNGARKTRHSHEKKSI